MDALTEFYTSFVVLKFKVQCVGGMDVSVGGAAAISNT